MPLANPLVLIQIGSFVNASPARTALPAAHFDRNANYRVTDLVH